MAFGQSITVGDKVFQNVDPGLYIEQTSTIDEPDWLVIDRTINPDGMSSFLIQRKLNKNSLSSVPGAVDDVLQVHVVLKFPLKSFTQADVEDLFADLKTFLSTANVTKLLRGER